MPSTGRDIKLSFDGMVGRANRVLRGDVVEPHVSPPLVAHRLHPFRAGVQTRETTLPTKNKVRLIHTSDVHLGDGLGHPQAEVALRAVVDAVPRLGGDMLLLVGDIFDNDRVSDKVVQVFLEQMGRLAVPAVVLPGNHDLYDDGSVYRRDVFLHKPPNLHIITRTEGESIEFPKLTLNVWGRAMAGHTPAFRPLDGMPARCDGRWLVALAHGHFHFDDDLDQRSSPIYPSEVAAATCDYLALGLWVRHADVSQGRVKAVYSGTARGPSSSGGLGAVTVVDLDPQRGVSFRQASL